MVNGKVTLELCLIISMLNSHYHVYVIMRLRDHEIVRWKSDVVYDDTWPRKNNPGGH